MSDTRSPCRSIIETENLTRTIQFDGAARTIVDSFTYRFECARIHSLIGPSGAGKSSLLRLLNRLDEPTGGEVRLDGKSTASCNPLELRRKVGFLFQTPHVFDGTVRDNLLFVESASETERLRESLNDVHLDPEMLDRSAANLSVGEKQRVALARLLISQPEVLLLDEPTSALDPTGTRIIEELIDEVTEARNLTVITVTHDPQQALRLGGHGLLMVAGRLIEYGAIEQLVNEPRSEEGRKYKAQDLS